MSENVAELLAEIQRLTDSLDTCRELRSYDQGDVERLRARVAELEGDVHRIQTELSAQILQLTAELATMRGQKDNTQ